MTDRKKQLGANASKELGMSAGSAAHRLTRKLLFHYAQKTSDDICYRCGLKIETYETFSIEHKKPWLHVSPDLFWDLSNIAFSHLKCNVKAANHGNNISKRIVGEAGTSWCSGHRQFFPVDRFHKNRSTWNGLHRSCKDCHRKYGG